MIGFLLGFSICLNIILFLCLYFKKKSDNVFKNLSNIVDHDLFDDFYSDSIIKNKDREEVKHYDK